MISIPISNPEVPSSNNTKRKYFAVVYWMAEDIKKSFRPGWTDEECMNWLCENEEQANFCSCNHSLSSFFEDSSNSSRIHSFGMLFTSLL
jgi:hypothetical protein